MKQAVKYTLLVPILPTIEQLTKARDLSKEIDDTLDDLENAQTKLNKNIADATRIVFSIFNESDNDPWRSVSEICLYTGLTRIVVLKVLEIDNSRQFCENDKKNITTRHLYDKKRSFWNKFYDSYINRIR